MYLRCASCAGMNFKAHVRPKHQAARLTVLECLRCKKIFKVDDDAFLEGDGKIDIRENDKRLLI